MKLKLMAMSLAAAYAVTAAAMPTKEAIEKANKEVRESLKAQISAWKDGKLSDGELSGLMLAHADKFADEARHYACIQAAFAAAARAGDAVQAAKALARLKADVKDFDGEVEKALFEKVIEKVDAEAAKAFAVSLAAERAKIECATHITDASAATIGKMKSIVLPSLDIKAGTTLEDAVETLVELGRKYDAVEKDEEKKGFYIMTPGVVSAKPYEVRRLPASGKGEGLETREYTFSPAFFRYMLASLRYNKDGSVKEGVCDDDWKRLFAEDWPAGSSLVCNDKERKVVVTNTRDSLDQHEEACSMMAEYCIPMPSLPAINKGAVSFYDAVKAVAESAGLEFEVKGFVVGIKPSDAAIRRRTLERSVDMMRNSPEIGMHDLEYNGRMLWDAMQFVKMLNPDAASVLPRTEADKDAEEGDIARFGFKSAGDYFTVLFDVYNKRSKEWRPNKYIRAGVDVIGKGAAAYGEYVNIDKLDWCIAANVGDNMPDNTPILVSANFNPALLLRKWDGKTDADKVLPVGPASGAARSICGDKYVVIVYKNDGPKVIKARELTYANIYGEAFDATLGNPVLPLAYLTPTGVAQPTGAAEPVVAVDPDAETEMPMGVGTMPEGWTDDLEAAKAQAAKEGKRILVYFTEYTGGWLKSTMELEKEVFSKKIFGEVAKKDYVLVKIEVPKKPSKRSKNWKDKLSEKARRNWDVADKYDATLWLPTVSILDADGKVLGTRRNVHRLHSEGPVAWLKKIEFKVFENQVLKGKGKAAESKPGEAE